MDEMIKQEMRKNHLLRTPKNFDRESANEAKQKFCKTLVDPSCKRTKIKQSVLSNSIEGRGPYVFGQITFTTTTGNFECNPENGSNTAGTVFHTIKAQITGPERN